MNASSLSPAIKDTRPALSQIQDQQLNIVHSKLTKTLEIPFQNIKDTAEKFSITSPKSNFGNYNLLKISDLEPKLFDLCPITDILEVASFSIDKLALCYSVIKESLQSLIEKRYSDFDAQTTSNCCHGLSMWSTHLIKSLETIDLNSLQEECIRHLSMGVGSLPAMKAPICVLELARLYILAYIREIDPNKGILSLNKKLLQLHPVGRTFCDTLVKNLQHRTSNLVAQSYFNYFSETNSTMQMSQVPISLWGKYVHSSYLRSDKRGVLYAPCMFSMQISLARLIEKKAIIAFCNDLFDHTGSWKGRYLQLLRGNESKNQFSLVDRNEYESLSSKEPIIIFSGIAIRALNNNQEKEELYRALDSWMDKFSHLVLACDAYYPHFPRVSQDPSFDSAPILPDEPELQDLIATYKQVSGVSAQAPSLFCLNHIYPVSLEQIIKAVFEQNRESLPVYGIPKNLLVK